jgi:hypothetical protein
MHGDVRFHEVTLLPQVFGAMRDVYGLAFSPLATPMDFAAAEVS